MCRCATPWDEAVCRPAIAGPCTAARSAEDSPGGARHAASRRTRWGAVDDLEQLARGEGWQWAGKTDHGDIGLAEAVWLGPSATRVAYLDDRFLDLQYIAVEGEAEVAVAARIAEAVALHAAAPGPAEQAQSLLALSLLTGAEAAAERLARQDLAAGNPELLAAAVLAAAHVSPPDLQNLLAARLRVETDPRVRRRLDEVLGALGA